jgi:hypothetical protein
VCIHREFGNEKLAGETPAHESPYTQCVFHKHFEAGNPAGETPAVPVKRLNVVFGVT